MKSQLRHNIYQVSHVGPVDWEDMAAPSKKKHLSSEVVYASLNWIHHFSQGNQDTVKSKKSGILLNWIEALAFLRELASGPGSIIALRQALGVTSELIY